MAAVTNGASRGTSGAPRRPLRVAYAIIAVLTLVIGTVNTLSVIDEHAWQGRPIDWWEPALWEGSSGVVLLMLVTVPFWVMRRFPAEGPAALRHLAIHAALTLPFSVAHVLLMVAIRKGGYWLAGDSYDFGLGPDTLLYEYRKDVLSYVLYAAIYWLCVRLVGERAAAAPAGPSAGTIVIDEGPRVLRVAPAEILGARSAGNYVEFLLADGRRPLMRTTLAGVDETLAPSGFVRTHRSWLVNPVHVAQIEAEGSGDFGLTLADGTQVPLSRRYRHEMARLRGG